MKKILFVALLSVALISTSHAQMWNNGSKVTYGYPTGLTGYYTYTFPSFQPVTLETADTISLNPFALETYATVDTLKRHTNESNVLLVNPGPGQYAGCKLYLSTGTIDSTRTLYVVTVDSNNTYHTTDTLTTSQSVCRRIYLFDGNIYKKFPY